MQSYLKYFVFGVLLVTATFLAFQAGKKGIKHSPSVQSSHKLFRSFPVLTNSELRESGIKAQDNSAQEKPSSEVESKKSDSKEKDQENETKNKKKESKDNKEIKGEDPSSTSLKKVLDAHQDGSENFWSVMRMGEDGLKDRNKGALARKKGLPSFSSIYVPAYTVEQLTEGALYGFSASFPQDSPQGKLFVLEKQIGSRYEVHVYEQNGLQFRGAFETLEADTFPFQGIPSFQKVEASQFEHTSRFLVFTGSKGEIEELLSQESNVQSLFQTAYRSELDPQTFLGNDANFQLDLYKLFPGIFVAQSLR
ncbi:MAG: hypothetical protein A2Z91_06040 [Deltaproteobacteria bacterium GWA2_38_16]|nr:MAG: hypothetical protein A2Z91_06040 [Deltaproteobacteria bacterium GWA2_38_16]OGQ03753.1 MAG: hypothetical protein A3D19_02770 [Deltaproteobacteria bacterium RIFCSPHIGHO2_02_FULL_38_15]OGQ31441.1 MAG: hypothetical protein A3A72_07080 [Deltaproteobacteria bacterium RIFCSPLOWO2_01_FULL_38_9]OGQ59005.1 MAG: hypothetical protein A3G92_00385 [Deltaproteobacteria bacterium RIFCSPLOWO2_12_FULL_38_8]HBQ21315.1 hypothetical protein [Deltaproteobacteria bacterium]